MKKQIFQDDNKPIIVKRKFFRYGITYRGLTYQSEELLKLGRSLPNNPDVEIQINTDDIGSIKVTDPTDSNNKILAQVINCEWATGVSLENLINLQARAREAWLVDHSLSEMEFALLESRKKLQTIIKKISKGNGNSKP